MSHHASRRQLLLGSTAMAATALLPMPTRTTHAAERPHTLIAGPATVSILPGKPAQILAFNGMAPGPLLRVQQGQPFAARLINALDQNTTVHWHGLRLPNAMDGVGGLTQAAVKPGGTFDYSFVPPDAGTYWYHPHERSFEQVPRGLYGALIVEEPQPPQIDQDLVLLIADWRLNSEGQLIGGFGSRHDQSHAGRLGNTITVNGQLVPDIPVRRFERVRLRLINAATARVLALRINGADPMLIAYDGQPLPPTSIGYGTDLLLGPGNRADLMLDILAEPEGSLELIDLRAETPQILAQLQIGPEPIRSTPLVAPIALPDNPVPWPDLGAARRVALVMTGGAASEHDMSLMTGTAPIWLFNGKPVMQHEGAHHGSVLFGAKRGETVAVTIENRTAWPHAMHFHGHHFRLVSRDQGRAPEPWWWDTLLMEPGEISTIAFVADNPGAWMIHCHMLDHQAAGMMATFEVT